MAYSIKDFSAGIVTDPDPADLNGTQSGVEEMINFDIYDGGIKKRDGTEAKTFNYYTFTVEGESHNRTFTYVGTFPSGTEEIVQIVDVFAPEAYLNHPQFQGQYSLVELCDNRNVTIIMVHDTSADVYYLYADIHEEGKYERIGDGATTNIFKAATGVERPYMIPHQSCVDIGGATIFDTSGNPSTTDGVLWFGHVKKLGGWTRYGKDDYQYISYRDGIFAIDEWRLANAECYDADSNIKVKLGISDYSKLIYDSNSSTHSLNQQASWSGKYPKELIKEYFEPWLIGDKKRKLRLKVTAIYDGYQESRPLSWNASSLYELFDVDNTYLGSERVGEALLPKDWKITVDPVRGQYVEIETADVFDHSFLTMFFSMPMAGGSFSVSGVTMTNYCFQGLIDFRWNNIWRERRPVVDTGDTFRIYLSYNPIPATAKLGFKLVNVWGTNSNVLVPPRPKFMPIHKNGELIGIHVAMFGPDAAPWVIPTPGTPMSAAQYAAAYGSLGALSSMYLPVVAYALGWRGMPSIDRTLPPDPNNVNWVFDCFRQAWGLETIKDEWYTNMQLWWTVERVRHQLDELQIVPPGFNTDLMDYMPYNAVNSTTLHTDINMARYIEDVDQADQNTEVIETRTVQYAQFALDQRLGHALLYIMPEFPTEYLSANDTYPIAGTAGRRLTGFRFYSWEEVLDLDYKCIREVGIDYNEADTLHGGIGDLETNTLISFREIPSGGVAVDSLTGDCPTWMNESGTIRPYREQAAEPMMSYRAAINRIFIISDLDIQGDTSRGLLSSNMQREEWKSDAPVWSRGSVCEGRLIACSMKNTDLQYSIVAGGVPQHNIMPGTLNVAAGERPQHVVSFRGQHHVIFTDQGLHRIDLADGDEFHWRIMDVFARKGTTYWQGIVNTPHGIFYPTKTSIMVFAGGDPTDLAARKWKDQYDDPLLASTIFGGYDSAKEQIHMSWPNGVWVFDIERQSWRKYRYASGQAKYMTTHDGVFYRSFGAADFRTSNKMVHLDRTLGFGSLVTTHELPPPEMTHLRWWLYLGIRHKSYSARIILLTRLYEDGVHPNIIHFLTDGRRDFWMPLPFGIGNSLRIQYGDGQDFGENNTDCDVDLQTITVLETDDRQQWSGT